MEKTTQQLKSIFAACRKLGIDDDTRATLVIDLTDGRTSSCKDITYSEAKQFVRQLNSLLSTPAPKFSERYFQCDNMRKKILSFFHEMNYRVNGKLDMERVEKTIIQKGYLKKPLNSYKYEELPKLVSQFESIRNSYLKDVSK